MDKSLISVRGLSHRYNTQWAIRGISFDLPETGVYGLLGSNGAGKSTTMNIISGVLKQTEGEVIVNGISLNEDPIAAKKLIGFLPQHAPLHPDTTVQEYLSNCARLRKIPEKEVRNAVNEVMEKVSITHFEKRLIRNLSGGYKQRVGIAQAIIHKPAIIILDEPTNGLDPNQIMEVRKLVRDIAKERAVIFSTHILTEVHAICDHILMIDRGKLVFSGETREFDNYLQPDSLLVRLLAAPPVEQILQIAGITDAEALGGGEYRLKIGGSSRIAEQFIVECVSRNWRLETIHPEKTSLNDVFSELSNKNA
ncbi:ABC transporter ATP-binding protein [Mucilaginibacter auburnensis]|uniref:ABC-2 type transport system ATP-binding protein n=1 Tax=Mucilaginibacter auburnensis TaxID=1457233 RepID=A0A2H9VW13_9SPHI|nr:ABC transporter ATP-binding protein [Mucilaginibacter auburnensis]PJJ85023.1 ABC-2 type transport system ATP-binding protein [Mucilaginibacter auburnensis]